MVTGLAKYSAHEVRQRASSPKLQVLNTALISAQANLTFETARRDPVYWGRIVESAVGAYLLNSVIGTPIEIFYWREGNHEVDFVIRNGEKLIAIEVKSTTRKEALPGMDAFNKLYKPDRMLLVGGSGIPLEKFLQMSVVDL